MRKMPASAASHAAGARLFTHRCSREPRAAHNDDDQSRLLVPQRLGWLQNQLVPAWPHLLGVQHWAGGAGLLLVLPLSLPPGGLASHLVTLPVKLPASGPVVTVTFKHNQQYSTLWRTGLHCLHKPAILGLKRLHLGTVLTEQHQSNRECTWSIRRLVSANCLQPPFAHACMNACICAKPSLHCETTMTFTYSWMTANNHPYRTLRARVHQDYTVTLQTYSPTQHVAPV